VDCSSHIVTHFIATEIGDARVAVQSKIDQLEAETANLHGAFAKRLALSSK